MRPLRLIMNAFGPYRGKIDLDFTKFGTSSIFLVNGPTGAGKTMIFDALTYALYNATSGQMREADMLKSQFATDEDLCYVELIFEIAHTEYRIYRVPQQTGPGTRTKTKKWTSEIEFYKEDTLVSTGRDANADIQALMGLTVDQFRQIVMLPQGEFRRLLVSGSNEKEQIFRNIFGTANIQAFQERLKDKRKDFRAAFKEYEAKREQILSSIPAEEGTDLATAIMRKDSEQVITNLENLIGEMGTELKAARAEKVKLDQVIKKEETIYNLLSEQERLKKQEATLMEQKEQIEAYETALLLHEQAQLVKIEVDKKTEIESSLKKTELELKTSKEKLTETQTKQAALIDEEEKSNKEVSELPNLRKKIQDLEAEQLKFTDLTLKNDALKQFEQELKETNKQKKQLEQFVMDYQKEVKKLEADLANIHIWREDLKQITKQLQALDAEHKETRQQEDIIEKILKLQTEMAGLINEHKEASKQARTYEEAYTDARLQYFGNLAGILATELADETPCPVCGSTHHPNLATQPMGTVNDEELAQLEEERTKTRQFENSLQIRLDNKATAIQEQQALLGSQAENYAERLAEVKASSQLLAENVREMEAAKEKLDIQLERENSWRKDLVTAQNMHQDCLLKLTKTTAKLETTSEKIRTVTSEIATIQENLHFESAAAVQAELDTKNERILWIEKTANDIQKQLTAVKTKEASLKATIRMLSKQLTEQEFNLEKQTIAVADLLEKYAFTDAFTIYLLTEAKQEQHTNVIKQYKEETTFTKRRLVEVENQLLTNEDNRSLAEITASLATLNEEIINNERHTEKLVKQMNQLEISLMGMVSNFTESEKIAKPLAIYEELAEIADGKKRAGYVSFERYVLSIYFEEVLQAANQRFEQMTNNQYEMMRRENRTKGAGAEGLDIDVFDRYTGKTRSVNTLSGGETFKASLALALGLSDVIQSQQGGVRVETLFVDEGFGTLDADSLEMAIETLMELQTTGRLIGIISHVEELKERIPARIVVEKQQEGSYARIEVI